MILFGWDKLTRDEIIENINYGSSLLNGSSEELERLYKAACHHPPNPIIMAREEFERSGMHIGRDNRISFVKDFWPEMKVTLTQTLDVFRSEHFSQYTIEELQKILQKHPNRTDLRMELIKLQKQNKTKYIGRPKRKKRK